MAFQSVPDTASIVISYTGLFEPMQNTMAAKLPGGYTVANLATLAAAVGAAVVANWLPIQDDDFNYVSTTVRGLNLENDFEVVDTVGAAAGSVVGVAQPGNVTFSVKKASLVTGRSARGRIYWIGMPAASLATNRNFVKTADVAAIVAATEAIRVAINATVWTAVVVSRFTNNAKRSVGVTFDWATTVAVNENLDSNRNRLAE